MHFDHFCVEPHGTTLTVATEANKSCISSYQIQSLQNSNCSSRLIFAPNYLMCFQLPESYCVYTFELAKGRIHSVGLLPRE